MTVVPDILVIGGGPAGLAAAEVASAAGRSVWVADQKPSLGRKFLMAGKSGLNLTKDTDAEGLIAAVSPAAPQIAAALRGFDAEAVRNWAEGLGQPVFTGTSRRVFPEAMKASPLLRAWLTRLQDRGVRLLPRWRWTGELDPVVFETPEGPATLAPRATILALGGASWARLGSDGAWASYLPTEPFRPANMGFCRQWSAHMRPHFGSPVKPVRLMAGTDCVLGEFVVSERGVEGSGIYALSRILRDRPADLRLDLFPDRSAEALAQRLARPQGRASRANHWRKSIGLTGVKAALVREVLGPAVSDADLPPMLKALPLPLDGPRPMDEAISTAGGVPLAALDDHLMLRDRPGIFCAGEMLDWEAPTGGYLITTCLATGRHAANGALTWVDL